MPPKRNKMPPRNGFYFFMLDLKEGRNGRSFKSMKEAADAAGPLWRNMSPREKEPYNIRAADARSQMGKLTSDGLELDQIERQQQQEESKIQDMKHDIITTLKLAQKGNCIHEEMFLIIHVNIFCYSGSLNRHYPAEIAVAAFTLEDGVLPERVFHELIRPGPLPLGFARDAKLHSDETHQIPPPMAGDNEDNQEAVYEKLKQFLAQFSSKRTPILYADQKRMKMIQQVLDTWCYDAGEEKPLFQVYELEYMFHKLRNTVSDDDQIWSSETYSQREIEKDVYAYAKHIPCVFHVNTNASNHCSRSYVIRYAYIICDNCCNDLRITLIPGQHIPRTSNYVPSRACSTSSLNSFKSLSVSSSTRSDDDTRSLLSLSSRSSKYACDSESSSAPLWLSEQDSDDETASQASFASAVTASSEYNSVPTASFENFPPIGQGKARNNMRKVENWAHSVGAKSGKVPSIGRGRGINNN